MFECLFTFAGAKEMYLVTERPSTKAARELRRSLAVAGTPVMTFGSKVQQQIWGFQSHGGTPKWMVYEGKSD